MEREVRLPSVGAASDRSGARGAAYGVGSRAVARGYRRDLPPRGPRLSAAPRPPPRSASYASGSPVGCRALPAPRRHRPVLRPLRTAGPTRRASPAGRARAIDLPAKLF